MMKKLIFISLLLGYTYSVNATEIHRVDKVITSTITTTLDEVHIGTNTYTTGYSSMTAIYTPIIYWSDGTVQVSSPTATGGSSTNYTAWEIDLWGGLMPMTTGYTLTSDWWEEDGNNDLTPKEP